MNTESATAQELIAQGRKEEALRMMQRILSRRFGGVDIVLMQALSQSDPDTLEDILVDFAFAPLLTYEQLRGRLVACSEISAPSRGEEVGRHPLRRISPRGGIPNTRTNPSPAT